MLTTKYTRLGVRSSSGMLWGIWLMKEMNRSPKCDVSRSLMFFSRHSSIHFLLQLMYWVGKRSFCLAICLYVFLMKLWKFLIADYGLILQLLISLKMSLICHFAMVSLRGRFWRKRFLCWNLVRLTQFGTVSSLSCCGVFGGFSSSSTCWPERSGWWRDGYEDSSTFFAFDN